MANKRSCSAWSLFNSIWGHADLEGYAFSCRIPKIEQSAVVVSDSQLVGYYLYTNDLYLSLLHRRFLTCSIILFEAARASSTHRPQNTLLIGTAAPLPLMFRAALLLKTLITPRVMATQRTSARGKNLPTRKACSLPVKPSWSVIPVAMKELATPGSMFSAEITPAISQN